MYKPLWVDAQSPDPIGELCAYYKLPPKDVAAIRAEMRKDKSGDITLGIALCARAAHLREMERQDREARVVRNTNSAPAQQISNALEIPVFGEVANAQTTR